MTQRSVQASSKLPAWAAGLYAAMDARDIDGVLDNFSEDARMCSGNAEPIVGHDAIRAASTQFFGSINGMSHEFYEVWECGDSALMTCDVDYTRSDGTVVRLPAATFIHHRADGLIDDIRVFMDMAPVFMDVAPDIASEESHATDSPNVATVKRFYNIADRRETGDLTELFTEDVKIFAPKFGTATGIEAMIGAGKGGAMFRRMAHHVDEFEIVEIGDRVIVEGTTEGETITGRTWDGRETIGGQFCSVFDFRDGRIRRMHVYFDPDHTNEDADRYPWYQQSSYSATA
jgi:ketosteroid isomerase-like protein